MAETIVKPSAIIRSQVINLPPADQFTIRIYTPCIGCFRLDPEADLRKVYWELRCGLSDALVEYPLLAGRIVECDEGRNRVQINVSVDDGVPFKYNDLTSSETQPSLLDFDTLEQAHFPPSQLDSSLSPVDKLFPTGSNPKALLLQANFIKGGLLLAIAPHHVTSDAAGLNGFVRSWAKYTAAAAKRSRVVPQPSLKILDRSPLFQFSNDTSLEDHKQLVKVDDVTELPRLMVEVYNNIPATRATSNILNVYWYFSPERLRALKAASQPTNKAGAWVSTNDALCALLWRHITIARQLKDSAYENSALQIPCSIRGKLSPRLNPDYVGNAVIHARLSYPIKELCSIAPNCLPLVASAIRKAISEVDEPTTRSIYGIIDSLPTIGSARYDFEPGSDVYVTSLAETDFYNIDWGIHMGRLARNRFAYHSIFSGAVVKPRFTDGGLEVFMTPDTEVLERLRRDETFTRFAELRCC